MVQNHERFGEPYQFSSDREASIALPREMVGVADGDLVALHVHLT